MAISGAIIPEPLAMPEIFMVLLSIANSSEEPFANVSVVIIALAALSNPRGDKPTTNSLETAPIFFQSKCSPITPVDAEKTFFSGMSNS